MKHLCSRLPNLENHFEVDVDTFNYAMGTILMQEERMIAYHS